MKYEIVTLVEGIGLDVIRLTEANLLPAMEIRGFVYSGISRNPHHRAELQGQPKFQGLCGPMYGGPGLIRYEDVAAYRQLST